MEDLHLSKTEWEDFTSSSIWVALLFELKEREDYLVELFKGGDLQWGADMIRGKLHELDFFRQIPQSIIASLIIQEKQKQK